MCGDRLYLHQLMQACGLITPTNAYMHMYIHRNVAKGGERPTPTNAYMPRMHTCIHAYVMKPQACITHECIHAYMHLYIHKYIQPIADRVAQNFEIISEKFQFSTRRTSILMGFIISTIYYVVLIVNPMGRILVF